MKRTKINLLEWLGWLLFIAVILWGSSSAQAQMIGKTIDKGNYKEYEALLIPPMVRAVERGDWVFPTGQLNFPYRHMDSFLAEGEKNAGKYDVNEEGDLIEKDTRKIPTYNIYGFPFPKIDPKDPKAGVKIMWNFNFQKYHLMGMKDQEQIYWVGKGGQERYANGINYNLFFQGRPPGHELKNPQGFLFQDLQNLKEPMSIKGTNGMAWDYLDERQITQFFYIPAIRRIRQVSGAARSDSWQGSDGWMDMNLMWAGKNRTMKWELAGEKTVLVPFTQITKEILEEAPDGTLSRKCPPIDWNFKKKSWVGSPWATTSITFVPRSVWVVKQWPNDPYYNWGLHINYVDKETSVIFVKEVYNKAGEYRFWNSTPLHYGEARSGRNDTGRFDVILEIDERIPHATIFDQQSEYAYTYMPASRLGTDFFTMSHFLQLSK